MSALASAQRRAADWRDGYDWRAAEAVLNGFHQYTRARSTSSREGSGPAGAADARLADSVWEFHRVIPPLSEDFGHRALTARLRLLVRAGGASSSRSPTRSTALMAELGHARYLVAAGDWGSCVAVRLAHAYPDAVRALHLYMMPLAGRPRRTSRRRAPRSSTGSTRRAATCTSRARGRRRSPMASTTRRSACSPGSPRSSTAGPTARRARRRRPVHRDDLLGDRRDRLLVLALLRAPARRLGARRRRRRRRPHRRAADVPRLPRESSTSRARGRARVQRRALGDARGTAATSRRSSSRTCSLRA